MLQYFLTSLFSITPRAISPHFLCFYDFALWKYSKRALRTSIPTASLQLGTTIPALLMGDNPCTICREPPTHLRLLPVRHCVGIARFLSIPTCTFSFTKIGTVVSSCGRSELARDDGWRKRACTCLVPRRRNWLCSCCGSAGTACW